jgi:hypothetical protein
MSSAAVANASTVDAVVADKPVRRVVTKRTPKSAAAAAAAAAATNDAPVALPTAAVVVADDKATIAKAAKAAKAAATKAAKAAKNIIAAADVPVAAIATPTEAVTKALAKRKGGKKATATISEEDSVAGTSATADDAAGPAAAAAAGETIKRVRAPKVHRTFFTAFGDLNDEEKARDFSKEAYEEWKVQTLAALDMRFKEWERVKREFNRVVKKLQKKKKRTAKGYNWEATAENHLLRLKEMPKEEFAELDNTWLSNYQFTSSFTADQLTADGCPEKGAIATFTVYLAAIHHGFKPLGIVSENATRTGTELAFTTPVEGRREYVGVALPFQNKERSKFSVLPKDRVANDL